MMKVAALDLGTNSFLCLIAEVENGEIKKVFSDQVQIVRLGQDVNKTKSFHPEALQRAARCLEDFKKTIEFHRPERILAMATSAARDVVNSQELFQIGKSLNIPIEIIPGNREAEISFYGATSGFPRDLKKRAVIDIGGGSTEIIVGTHQKLIYGQSVDVGALRLTEMFFPQQPPSQLELKALEDFLGKKLENLLATVKQLQIDVLVAVAGTPTELAAAMLGGFDPVKIEGFCLTTDLLDEWILKLMKSSTEERVSLLGISKGRADIILAGAVVLRSVLKGLGIPQTLVSTRGVRFGVALELEKRQ